YDSAKGEVFAPDGYNSNLAVISDSTNSVITTLTISLYPGTIAYNAAKGEIFVSVSNAAAGLNVISDSDNSVKIIKGGIPGYYAYNSAKSELSAETANNTVSVLTDSSSKVVATLSSKIGPMAYDIGKNELFLVSGYSTISVVTPTN
ncbi:MAG: hypothetical protein ABR924_21925, partial [Terracidiphilus sp.]